LTALLGFLGSRLAQYLIGAVVIAAVIGGIWKSGYNYRDKLCNVAALQADIAALKRDLDASRSAANDAQKKTQDLEQQTETQRKVIRDYEDFIKRNPNPACLLTDDDVNRLRDIRSGRK